MSCDNGYEYGKDTSISAIELWCLDGQFTTTPQTAVSSFPSEATGSPIDQTGITTATISSSTDMTSSTIKMTNSARKMKDFSTKVMGMATGIINFTKAASPATEIKDTTTEAISTGKTIHTVSYTAPPDIDPDQHSESASSVLSNHQSPASSNITMMHEIHTTTVNKPMLGDKSAAFNEMLTSTDILATTFNAKSASWNRKSCWIVNCRFPYDWIKYTGKTKLKLFRIF